MPTFFHRRAYYTPRQPRYGDMTYSATIHTLSPPSRVCSIRADGSCACGYRQSSETTIKIHPNFRPNSTGKERDEETGYGYFGARYMDHELMTKWLSVDPMADKDPYISPYSYCAWNPVRLIDPDGREVWVVGDDGGTYKYKNGKLYQMDGTLYKGKDKFANRVCKDLRRLEKKGLKTEINEMAFDGDKHIVIHSTEGGNGSKADSKTLETNGKGCGTRIKYNPNLREAIDGKRKSYIGLAHELGHAYNSFCGDVDNTDLQVSKLLYTIDNGNIHTSYYKDGTIKMHEIYAVRFENKVRGKNNQRVTYDGFYIGDKL